MESGEFVKNICLDVWKKIFNCSKFPAAIQKVFTLTFDKDGFLFNYFFLEVKLPLVTLYTW